MKLPALLALCMVLACACLSAEGPDPAEIPLPPIATPLGRLPGVNELPVRAALPDVLVMDDGTKVTTAAQWKLRREEMRRTLEYYATGQMPPAPGNVSGTEEDEYVFSNAVELVQVRP